MKRDPRRRLALAKKIGRTARTARRVCGLTQREVADRIGMDQANYVRLEQGRTLARLDLLLDLARTLRVSIGDLAYGRKTRTYLPPS